MVLDMATFGHGCLVCLFFLINLLVYEFVVFGGAALIVIPFIKQKWVSYELAEKILLGAIRLSFMIVVLLCFLWGFDVYRLIPVP